MRYGFIGLGAMGQRMAMNVSKNMKKGDSLSVFDVVTSRATMGNVMQSPVEVARDSETIITSLPEGKHVKSVFEAIVPTLGKSPKLFIDCSTIDVKTSLETAKLVNDAGHTYVDAPVSGGTIGAENATLTFMVGTDNADLVTPALSMMGKKIFCCGYQSAGLAAKLANNYILALQNLATCEGFALASKLGLDMKTFSDIVDVSSGQSWSSRVNNPVPGINPGTPSSRNYEGGFAVNLMKKDLKLAIEAAKLANSELPLGSHAPGVYETLNEFGSKDFSVLYKVLTGH